ncbi:ABC transporter permease [candidate division KSB1 bacterium]|nr:ABC transporter permease [candidate division KSB1 bacterium]
MNANLRQRSKITEWITTVPSLTWLIVFFLIPTLIIFLIAFRPADPYGGVGKGWTLETVTSIANLNYPAIIWRTIWISLLTTVVCIFLAVPTAYYMARLPQKWRQTVMLLIIIPFWTSFLIRIFAWKVMLHPEGFIKKILVYVHLIGDDASLLYTPAAVIIVLVYTYLPFAILPIYAAAEKFNFNLLEAARDLGAHSLRAFFAVFLPNINRGIITAILMVLIPTLGAYVIPDIVGGPNSEMIGNKIAQRTFVDRNLPQASWLSAVLTLAVLAPMLLVLSLQRRKKDKNIIFTEGL